MSRIDRREFIVSTVAASVASTALGRSPEMLVPSSTRPVIVCSANGHQFKNGGTMTCIEKAFSMMTSGADVLDSLIAGVNIVELDPLDYTVGYGGLPNADGVVQLDSSCMHGPKKRAGAVAALEGVRTPSLVAKAVMDNTDHHLLVGKGAQTFARQMGFAIEDDLNTKQSREMWLDWKRRTDPSHFPKPADRERAGRRVLREMIAEGTIDGQHAYGTINCNGVNSKGEVCGVTTTSGLAFKIPGRTGDSPILGAGLYVDGDAGAAGSTGRGEANLFNLSSFLVVEKMRQGMHPKDAAMEAVKRIKSNTVEKRLLNSRGLPNFNVNFYVVDVKGRYAGVSLWTNEKVRYAVCTENGPQIITMDGLLAGDPAA